MKSNTLTILLCAAIAAMAFGCGAPYDDSSEPTDDFGELGTVEEAINIGNGGYGFSTASAHLSCAQPGTSGQSCWIPGTIGTSVRWCFGQGTFTTAEKTALRAGIVAVDSLVNRSFVEGSFDSSCELELDAANPGGGTTFIIDNYMAAIPLFPTSLTSPAGVSHVNGTWKSFDTMQVLVGTQKVAANFFNFGPNALLHIGGHAAGLFLGLGTTTPSTNSYMRRPMTALLPVPGFNLTSGEVCRANAQNEVSPTTVSAVTACGS